jgi:hypothetical protein
MRAGLSGVLWGGGSGAWWRSRRYSSTLADGTVVNPTWIFDGLNWRFAKASSPTGPVSEVPFNGLLESSTRASNKTRFDSAGNLVTLGVNEFDRTYDPATLQPLGLEGEEQRTNSLLNSEVLTVQPTNGDNSSSTQYRCRGGSVALSTVPRHIEKFGAGRVFMFTEDTTTDSHALQSPRAPAAAADGEARAESVFVCAGTATRVAVTFKQSFLSSNDTNIKVDLSTGSILSASSSFSNVVCRNVGDGFYRITYTRTLNISSAFRSVTVQTMNGSDQTVDFAGTERTFYYTLPQVEITTGVASSPIPTAGTTVTRAQDEPFTTDMSWFNTAEGTFITMGLSGDGVVFGLGTTAAPRGQLSDSTSSRSFFVDGASTSLTASSTGTFARGQNNKRAAAYNASGLITALNGSVIATASGNIGIPYSPARLSVGRRYASAPVFYQNQPVALILYYPKRLTDAEIQRLTTL